MGSPAIFQLLPDPSYHSTASISCQSAGIAHHNHGELPILQQELYRVVASVRKAKATVTTPRMYQSPSMLVDFPTP